MGLSRGKSRKPSESPWSPPKDIVFFVDRSLGGKIVPEMLKSAGFRVERLEDHFKERERDHVWIAAVSKKKWIILSKDKFIDNRVQVLQTIQETKARMFVLTSGDMLGSEMSVLLKLVAREMVSIISGNKGPFIIKITQKGHFNRIDIEEKLKNAGM